MGGYTGEGGVISGEKGRIGDTAYVPGGVMGRRKKEAYGGRISTIREKKNSIPNRLLQIGEGGRKKKLGKRQKLRSPGSRKKGVATNKKFADETGTREGKDSFERR